MHTVLKENTSIYLSVSNKIEIGFKEVQILVSARHCCIG